MGSGLASNNASISTCAGTFHDSGGSGANYSNGENYTVTFCPTNSDKMRLTFSSFSLESNNDYMVIYDGNSTNSPVIDTYSATSPGTVTASVSCLTVKFVSNSSTVSNGWEASISCNSISGNSSTCDDYALSIVQFWSSSMTKHDGSNGEFIKTITSTNLSYPNAVTQLTDGRIIVANGISNKISAYNAYTGASLGDFVTTVNGGLDFPEQMKVAPNGNIYVASQNNNLIQEFNYTTGAFIKTVSDFTDNINMPSGIGFYGNDMYVSQNISGGNILKLNATTGDFISNLYSYPSGELPRGIAADINGDLFVNVRTPTGTRVDKFTFPAGTRTVFATLDVDSDPYAGIVWGPDERLYISDFGENEIHIYNPNGTLHQTITHATMNGPHGVAFVGCSPLNVSGTITNATCVQGDGAINSNPSGGIKLNIANTGENSYDVLWSNGATTEDISGLSAGTYTATITDWSDIQVVKTFVVTAPAPTECCPVISALDLSPSTICAEGDFSATISHQADLGDLALYYSSNSGLSPAQLYDFAAHESNSISTLSASISPTAAATSTSTSSLTIPVEGIYTIYTILADGNSNINNIYCQPMETETLTVNPKPTISLDNSYCVLTLPVPPSFTYTVEVTTTGNTLTSTAGNITNNGGGSYTISNIPENENLILTATTTASGCQQTLNITAPDCDCAAIASPTSGGDETICSGENIPTLTVTVGVGQTADWFDNQTNGTELATGTTSYTPTMEGIYYVEARDNTTQCMSSTRTAVRLIINDVPICSASSDSPICVGSSLNLSSTGGTSWSWSSDGSAVFSSATVQNPTATNISNSETFSVTVTDENNCSSICETIATVTAPPTLTPIDDVLTCNNGDDGAIGVNVSGGNPSYTYTWSTGANSQMVNNLSAGVYTVTVVDESNCITMTTAAVSEPSTIDIVVSTSSVSVRYGNDGSITTSVSGGTPSYSYLWSNGETTSSVNNLSAGTYSVLVIDANNCTKTVEATITQPVCPPNVQCGKVNVLRN